MTYSQPTAPTELAENRLKRMKMRAWRRGTKEMDLILGPYADAHLPKMPLDELEIFDQILHTNDQDLLPMVLGQTPAPAAFAALMAKIATHARVRLMPGAKLQV